MASPPIERNGESSLPPSEQVAFLQSDRHKPFRESLTDAGQWPLCAKGIEVLQLSLGRLCNQRCSHCHVNAGPDRREVMSIETMKACVDALAATDIPLLDITGGAPEMNANFRWLVEQARALGRDVIDRCNLTILMENGYERLAEFLAANRVRVVASLPCYLEENVDAQRGERAFGRSIEALRRLNKLGYGRDDSGLELCLVYNPPGAQLPPPQASLEEAYHAELKSRYGVVFNRLFTITNQPIGRLLEELIRDGKHDAYLETLVAAFNPAAAAAVMCRTTLSVDWTGRLFDCDFNQMLELDLQPDLPHNIRDFDLERLARRPITCGQHCHACTAGAGSSCQGTIT